MIVRVFTGRVAARREGEFNANLRARLDLIREQPGNVYVKFARKIGNEHAKYLTQHLAHGGLLLWVRTRDAEREKTALEILRRHSAEDVHLHELPERAGKESDVPRERPRVVHLLDWTIDFKRPLQRQGSR